MIYLCPKCQKPNRIPAARLDGRARCGSCKSSILPFDHPHEITDAAEFDEIVSASPLPVIVDFRAPWCGPCLAMAPELKKVALELTGRAVILKINAEVLPAVSGRFQIRAIPTLVRFDGGNEAKRTSGAQSAASLEAALGLARHAA